MRTANSGDRNMLLAIKSMYYSLDCHLDELEEIEANVRAYLRPFFGAPTMKESTNFLKDLNGLGGLDFFDWGLDVVFSLSLKDIFEETEDSTFTDVESASLTPPP